MRIQLFSMLAMVYLAPLAAAERPDESDAPPGRQAAVERGPDGLPKYRHPYADGLYSTVTAMNTFPKLDVGKQKKIKLKVPGFKRDFPVYTILQDRKAPLVVVLLGLDGKVDGPWGDLFPYWYNEYGFHVLTFDSPFTPQYPEISGQGVSGNFDAEADQIAAVIDTFIKTQDPAGNITGVGVIGMSFGASQALLLAAKDKAGRLPFKLSGCLALSPPVKLVTAARTLDRYFAQDRWDTTMIELGKKFGSHLPVAEGVPIPFSATEMRAAVGFVFRDSLSKVVERNDRYYKLRVLPSADSESNRKSHAEVTGLERYMGLFVFPYWQKRGSVKSLEELWDMSSLDRLLPQLPDYAQAIVCANDPFNDPDELKAAQASDANRSLIVHPTGGHLGYIASEWMLVKSLRIFGNRIKAQDKDLQIDDPRTPDQARKEARDTTREALRQPVPPPPPKKK